MKLYHYVHCPFCIRIRMVLGHLKTPYQSIVLPYNDEKTPIELMGVKMLPIMDFGDSVSNESLDIIAKLDRENRLQSDKVISAYDKIEVVLNEWSKSVHSLAMPYFIWTPEFDDASREYFQKKKEKKRGPFYKLVQNRENFVKELNLSLKKHEDLFEMLPTKDTLSLDHILYASHLWAMYIVPEFQFEKKVHDYLQRVGELCNFDYHEDFWRE